MYVLIKDKKRADYITLDEIIDFKRLDAATAEYITACKKGSGVFNDFRLLTRLIPLFLHRKVLPLVVGFLAFIISGNKIRNLRFGGDLLWLTCVDFCDPYKMDLDMAEKYCEEILAMKKGCDVVYSRTYDEALGICASPQDSPSI